MQRHVRDQLDEYLIGELGPDAARQFEEHVRCCRSCETALSEAQSARSYLAWLAPAEAPPVPGPGFYLRVQQSIERKLVWGWFGRLAASLRPRFTYPLALLGLLFMAWTLTFEIDAAEDSIFGFPPSEYSAGLSDEADGVASGDLVLMTLVDMTEED